MNTNFFNDMRGKARMEAGNHFKNRACRNVACRVFTVLILLTGISAYAQDVITLRSGDEIKAKVTEISSSEIKYKRFDNLDGPTVVVAKSDVFFIKYENGTKEVMGAIDETSAAKPESVARVAASHECTIIFYRKNKGIPVILKTMAVDITRKPEEKIISLWNATYYKHITSAPGTWEIIAGIKKDSKPIKLNLEAGKTYYLSCSAKDDPFFKYGATLEIVNEQQALQDISELEEVTK